MTSFSRIDSFKIPPYVRFVGALVAGIAIGVFTMQTIQRFFPFQPPPGVDYTSGPAYNAWTASLSNHAMLLMLWSFLVAALLGGFVTRLIAPAPAPFPLELIAGFVILFYSIVSFQAAPTPAWMTFISCPGCMILAWAGGWLGRRIGGRWQPAG